MLASHAVGAQSSPRPVTITVWAMSAEGNLIRRMADRFEAENPGIKVFTQAIPWEAAHEKLVTSVVADMAPDITQMGTTWMPEFQKMGVLAPVDPETARDPVFSPSRFFPGALTSTMFSGLRYGIPWYVDTRVIYYRRDLVAEAGYPKFPSSWEQFHRLCVELVRRNSRPGRPTFAFTLPNNDWQVLLMFLWQNGGEMFPHGASGDAFAPGGLEGALSYLKSFFDEKLSPKDSDRDNNSVNLLSLFETGYLPIFISGPWMISEIQKNMPQMAGKWATATLPASQASISFIGGSNLVLFKQSRHKVEAWKFIRFMSLPENQLRWYEISKDLPAVKAAWKTPALASDPLLLPFKIQLENAKSPPPIAEWEEVAEVLSRVMEQVLYGRIPVGEARQAFTTQIRRVLDKPSASQSGLFRLLVTIGLVVASMIPLFLYFGGGVKSKVSEKFPTVPVWFLLPAMCVLIVFLFLPVLATFIASLTNLNLSGLNNFRLVSYIGFENYLRLFKDPVFRMSLRNTLLFACLGVPLNVGLSLFMALVLRRKFLRWKPFFRIAYFIPVITTMVAVAMIWRWLYNPVYGLLNIVLAKLSLAPQAWLTNPHLALPSLILMALWKGFGYNTIIFFAALQAIPNALYESIEIDGATSWQQFRYVTLPMLRRAMFFVIIMTSIGYLQFFAEPYIMTAGGPLYSTMSVVLWMYLQGFKFYNIGYASAMAYVLFLIIFLLTFVQRKIHARIERTIG